MTLFYILFGVVVALILSDFVLPKNILEYMGLDMDNEKVQMWTTLIIGFFLLISAGQITGLWGFIGHKLGLI